MNNYLLLSLLCIAFFCLRSIETIQARVMLANADFMSYVFLNDKFPCSGVIATSKPFKVPEKKTTSKFNQNTFQFNSNISLVQCFVSV